MTAVLATLLVGVAFIAPTAQAAEDPTGTCDWGHDGGVSVLWVWGYAQASCLGIGCYAGAGTGAGVPFAGGGATTGCEDCDVGTFALASTVTGAYALVDCGDVCTAWAVVWGGVDGNLDPTYGIKSSADCSNGLDKVVYVVL